MSGRSWVVADHHFGHENIIKFKREDGTPLRNFSSMEEHDQTIIQQHNLLVKPEDRVYLLGDFAINRHHLYKAGQLNGRLVLVKGNHDIMKLDEYRKYFDDIRSYVVQKDQEGNKVILSHIPIHPDSVGRFGTNIHGHLHYQSIDDPRYVCVSLEHTDFKPIQIYEALKLRQLRK
jgi:calcineurin-like phosphoesterase family protein